MIKAKEKDSENPVRKRLMPITRSEIKTTLLTPKRVARNPPITESNRYPIKLPMAINPSSV
jgi:hypothetical protein